MLFIVDLYADKGLIVIILGVDKYYPHPSMKSFIDYTPYPYTYCTCMCSHDKVSIVKLKHYKCTCMYTLCIHNTFTFVLCVLVNLYMSIECRGFESHPRQLIFLWKSDCLGCVVLLCLVVCLTLLLSSLISLTCTCTV